ncbi:M23 family metallopeptidase [Labrenzia sp. DG1229]|uniref:M23 family metallopeptidase n=1 Tax=Labrenzia sp. DG1229 TaxID=681847 RepID=UPI00068EB2EC|nr:M23 family metallopeptidase [Labrenzia sp. DG1229]
MVQWSDNQNSGANRPEFDRTVIRPSGKPANAPQKLQAKPARGQAPEPERPRAKVSSVATYGILAIAFLVIGGGIGGIAHLISSGAISLSSPETASIDQNNVPPPQETDDDQSPPQTDIAVADKPSEPGSDTIETTTDIASDEELVVPSDPFFDMAVSAVIPLAGDPVLLNDGGATQRIELSERPVPSGSESAGVAALPTLTAFVLDSQMLNESGDLVIRAPGSEADFQFGNFGGGEDSEGLVVDEGGEADNSTASNLPVFLKPPTDTLNLYLTERPIGQGASRMEIRKKIDDKSSLEAFLKENGFDDSASKPLLEFVKQEFERSDLIAGDKIAVRGSRMPNRLGRIGDYYRPVQLSLYSAEGYLGTAAYSVSRDGEAYVHGADPWFGKEVVQEKVADDQGAGSPKRHRLIDGLYATAVRNAVPASIVGEAIAYLAPSTDLKRAIKPDERFTLVFTDMPRDEKRGGGRVLFAGVRRGDDWSVRCYVLKAPGNRGFACVSEGGKISLSGAMLVPVKGVLTSKFGMRFHPIKKTERLHAGVDWAAPTGTPIRAAFSGKVTYKDVRGGYGNFIELTHKDGITSRYAHMHEYADGVEKGSVVQAGDLIGYVGTTGLSTGPHLHFEIRQRGEPADPLSFEMETGADAPQSVASKDLKTYRGVVGEILAGQ